MMIDTWGDVLSKSFQGLWLGVINFAPQIVVAILIIVIGWLIGSLVGRAIAHVIRSLRIDEALRKSGIEDTLGRGGIVLNSGAFVGGLVKWFIIVVFLVAAFDVLHLSQVNAFLQGVVLYYLPNVIIAVLILLFSAVIGDIMQKVVTTSARTAEIKSARFLGSFTKWAIWVFAILVALEQLNIAAPFIQTLFTGIVVAVSLAIGLSFGLGGQEAAARFIEKTKQEISHRD